MFGSFADSLWPTRDSRAKDEHFSVRPLMAQWQDGDVSLEPMPCALQAAQMSETPTSDYSQFTDNEYAGIQSAPEQYEGLRGELNELLASVNLPQPDAPQTTEIPNASEADAQIEDTQGLQAGLAMLEQPPQASANLAPVPAASQAITPAQPQAPSEEAVSALLDRLPEALRGTYTRSLRRLEDKVYDLAGALTSLDGIDVQLNSARDHLGALRAQGMPIDYNKVRNVLEEMATAVGTIVQEFDDGDLNLLGDARIQIAFSEHGKDSTADQSIDLNLIPIDKLIRLSSKLDPTPSEIDRFVELLSRTLDGNIQILSGIMLTLFAARDYTNSVTELAVETGVAEKVPMPSTNTSQQALSQPTDPVQSISRTSGETALGNQPDGF